MIRILTLILVLMSSLSAGQSLTTGPISNTSFPSHSRDLPYRVEFYIHDWPASPCQGCRPFNSGALGFDAYFTGGQWININSPGDASEGFVIPLATFPSKRMYVRFQRDPSVRTLYLEIWDEKGNRLISNSISYVPQNGTNPSGAEASGLGAPLSFVRVHSTLLPLNSRPPLHHDDDNRLLEWKFDGNRNDSSGNNYNGSGAASYVATPDQRAYSVIKVNGTSWSNWTSLRAGFPSSLRFWTGTWRPCCRAGTGRQLG